MAKAVANTKADTIRKKVQDLRKQVETAFIEMAGPLLEIRENEYYKDWNFSSFADYCEFEVGMKPRRAVYLTDVWKMKTELKIPETELKAIGWTKAKELVSSATKDNIKELLQLAKDNSTRELHEEMQKRNQKGLVVAAGRKILARLTFTMDESEADVITSALDAAKEVYDTDNGTSALESICQFWLQENEEAAPPSIDSIIKYVKNVFNVTLVEELSSPAEKKADIIDVIPEAEKPEIVDFPDEDVEQEEVSEREEHPVEKIRTKKQLRAYIKENSLGVKIARNDTIAQIKDKIMEVEAALSSGPAEDDDVDDAVDDVDIEALAEEDSPKENTEKPKAKTIEEEDFNEILGLV